MVQLTCLPTSTTICTMTNTHKLVFIDSDAFIALAKIDDANHQKAKRLFSVLHEQGCSCVTSNLVFSEVTTVLSQRVGRQAALAFIDTMQAPDNDLPMIFINKAMHEHATTLFKAQKSKNISFVDCTNMAMIQMLPCNTVLSFDHIYRKNQITLFA